jgi:hypothetical protein
MELDLEDSDFDLLEDEMLGALTKLAVVRELGLEKTREGSKLWAATGKTMAVLNRKRETLNALDLETPDSKSASRNVYRRWYDASILLNRELDALLRQHPDAVDLVQMLVKQLKQDNDIGSPPQH